MPSDMPRLPGGLRPTIRLGAKHLVVSVSPEAAKQALEEKVGEWTPPADLVPVFERLPSPLVSLSITDPRPTLPAALASLPATLQKTINTVLVQAQASRSARATPRRPPAGSARAVPGPRLRRGTGRDKEPATITLEVDPAKMPGADALKALLFPGSSAVTVDDQSIQFIRREAFPESA